MSNFVASFTCAICAVITSVSLSSANEASIIQACSQMTSDALRTISVQASSTTKVAWFHSVYCAESKTYKDLTTQSKAHANVLVPDVLKVGGSASGARMSVEEAYDAFCAEAESFDGVDQNYFARLKDLSAEANRTARFCLESASLGVEAAFTRPTDPTDLTFFSLRGKDGATRYIKGVYATGGATCSVDGRPVEAFYGSRDTDGIPFDASTVTVMCKRAARPIELFGVPAEFFPRTQITVVTSYSGEPFQLAVPEAATAPMSNRIAQLEGQISALQIDTQTALEQQRAELLEANRSAFNALASQYRHGEGIIGGNNGLSGTIIQFEPPFESVPKVFAMRRDGSPNDGHALWVGEVTASSAKVFGCRPGRASGRDTCIGFSAGFDIDWFAFVPKEVRIPQ